jgi:hypothetical protein
VTSPAVPPGQQQALISAARAARARCLCQEQPGTGPCDCPAPLTREQAGRLNAYAGQHPERVFIMSQATGQWMSALASFLPLGPDAEARVTAWMSDPYTLPQAADLLASPDLGDLLDMLKAPPAGGGVSLPR